MRTFSAKGVADLRCVRVSGECAVWLPSYTVVYHMSVTMCGALRLRYGGNNPEHGRANVKHSQHMKLGIFDVPLLID